MKSQISVLIIAIWIILCLSASILSKRIFSSQKELSRKIIHIGIGPIIPLAWWLEVPRTLAISASTIVTLGLIINYRIRLIPTVEDIERKSYGTIAYATTISTLLFFYWPINAALVTAAVLVMAFADGLAGLLGRHINSPNWKIYGQRKSVIGTLTMAIIGIVILMSVVIFSELPFNIIKILIVTCIAVGLEQISFLGIDNLTVPLAIALTWKWMIS